MTTYPTLFITHRGARHQQAALQGAPPELEITMLRDPSKEDIVQHLPGKRILITERAQPIDAQIIAAGDELELVQRLGSQTYDIDLAAARAAGIPVCYQPIGTTIMVAEHMLLQLLALAKRLREAMHAVTLDQDWGMPPKRCTEDHFVVDFTHRQGIGTLYHQTVGILGFGEIGIELARRLKGFECTVLYNKRSRLPETAERDLAIHFASQDDLARASDYLCILLPYSPETEEFIDKDFIAMMKAGACIVNCGGSPLLNEADVRDALASGRLGGVASDTFVWEPIRQDNPLLDLARVPDSNMLLTGHTASGSLEAAGLPERFVDYTNIRRWMAGEPLLFQVA
ncbi:MAG: hypothetical protein HPY76_00900 [Anaerolineae bacterium]|nr:hypothetical protein [Anaerolineae bacterium]